MSDNLIPFWKAFGLDEPDDRPNPPPVIFDELTEFVERKPQTEETKRRIAFNLSHYQVWRDALKYALAKK